MVVGGGTSGKCKRYLNHLVLLQLCLCVSKEAPRHENNAFLQYTLTLARAPSTKTLAYMAIVSTLSTISCLQPTSAFAIRKHQHGGKLVRFRAEQTGLD